MDDNQPKIVKALRGIGCSIMYLHQLGSGNPDLCVGYRGKNYLIEIKDGDKAPSKQKLTDDEQTFFATWSGQCAVANCEEAAIRIVTEDAT